MSLTTEQSYKTFKQINYKILAFKTLKSLFATLKNEYEVYEETTNSYYYDTGLISFNQELEELENYYYELLNKRGWMKWK